jgi:eukaryotic-like serine/threonine-protein kinase
MASVRAIGRFEIRSESASGSAGTVYQAIDTASGARVAVKVIRGLSPSDGARFSREARTLAQIRHPGVVRYIDHGHTDEGHAYLVMEWLEGEDVRGRLVRAGLSIRESVTLGLRVAEALAAIHEQGLVHRDLKPANVFLPGRRVDDAKIIDFGLIHTDWASVEVTRTGMVVGTPSYMAPEQARGQRTIDPRADVFSLGCVLFKCLTGRAPFEGQSVLAVLTKVLLEEAPTVRDLRPEVPPALDALVTRMIQKDAAHRPQSALAVAHELAALTAGEQLGDTMEPVPPSTVLLGLTTGEQRVAVVVLVGRAPRPTPAPVPVAEATLPNAAGAPAGAPAGSPAVDLDALAEEHGGRVDTLRDGTRLVTIVASGPATDQAGRAARCALAIHAAFRGLPAVPIAVAACWSEVGQRQPTGSAVERAAALLRGLADPAVIALDDVAATLLGQRFEVVAGTGGALSLLGMRGVDPAARTLLGRAMPMVGRDWELGSIQRMFRSCADEREASSVLVTGAPGMGKSRLAHEAVVTLREDFPDVEVWWGRGDPLRAGSALGLLGQLVRNAVGVLDGELEGERRRHFADRIASLVSPDDAGWVAEVLGEVASVPFPDDASQALRAARSDGRLMSERLRVAWETLVGAVSATRPLLVVLEDLQWADAATVRLVGAALGNLGRRPWMVLALARPEVHETFLRLWEGRHLQEIRLTPLPRRAAERLARQALGSETGSDIIQRIAAQADGNAFYLEELIRSVAQAKDRGGGAGALPETVLAMVQARIVGLDAGTRRVLRAASVFGEVFWAGGVEALLGGSVPLEGWVDALVESELVVARPESRFAMERELGFRHALLREGAYATLTEGDRVLGHSLAAAWLEEHGEKDAMVLAQHFSLARDEARAAQFYLAAAGQAMRAADVEGGIARAEQALGRATTEPMRVECLSLLCEAHAWRGDWDRVSEVAGAVTALARSGTYAWIQAMTWKQSAAMTLGRTADMLSTVTALVTTEATPETAPMVAPALMVSVLMLCGAGKLEAARGILGRIEALVAGDAGRDLRLVRPVSLARAWISAWVTGDAWAALHHARTACASSETLGDAQRARFSRVFIGMSQWYLGLAEDAEAELRALSGGEDLLGMMVALYLAQVLLDNGALDDVRELATRRMDIGRALGGDVGALREAEGRWLLGEVIAREGAHEEAEAELYAALPGLHIQGLIWQAGAARLVDVLLARGKTAEALTLAREVAQAQVTSGGLGLRGSLTQVVLAEALHAAGHGDDARKTLQGAHDDLMARAARIDDAEVRARFLAGPPENARVMARARAWLGPGG